MTQHNDSETPSNDNEQHAQDPLQSLPEMTFAELEAFVDARPKLKAVMESLKTYPVVVINRDGTRFEGHSVPASNQAWALKHFDRYFMQWHNSRDLLLIKVSDLTAPTFPDAVALELYDADSGDLLVRHDLARPAEGSE